MNVKIAFVILLLGHMKEKFAQKKNIGRIQNICN